MLPINIVMPKGGKESIMSKKEKKMPGEFDPHSLPLNGATRDYFQMCFWNAAGYCDCKGQVIKINKRGVLFKRIYIDWCRLDGICEKGKEDHVWLLDKKPFIEADVKEGNKIRFSAMVYAYKRSNGTEDFGLKEPEFIEHIEDYQLPSDEELTDQSIESLVCEVCLYSDQCYGFCINETYRDEMFNYLKSLRNQDRAKEAP